MSSTLPSSTAQGEASTSGPPSIPQTESSADTAMSNAMSIDLAAHSIEPNVSRTMTRTRNSAGASREVTGLNRHTKNQEFYGNSSSMALLHRVQSNGDESATATNSGEDEGALVSALHNPEFTPASTYAATSHVDKSSGQNVTYYQECHGFINSFFATLHYIHPILDRSTFLAHCENLWFGNPCTQSESFKALYYSILSLGALVGTRGEDLIDGLSNVDWSRRFFDQARSMSSTLNMTTDLEMVQCYFFMAKICQNELNPHWAYMYVGLAVRTALAMGINREPPRTHEQSIEQVKAESRTWWGLYSLETEMSFAMGRPDTLGADHYHNRRFPQIRFDNAQSEDEPNMCEGPHCAIIESMVDFSRITKSVCLEIYQSLSPVHRYVYLADLEQHLDRWLDELPTVIRPDRIFNPSRSLKAVKDAQYMKKQRLVLFIRYHNLRMLLFAPLLTMSASTERPADHVHQQGVQRCLVSARQTIEVIYDTYSHHDFFRTWFYNTTYTLFAVSLMLVYIMQEASEVEKPALFGYVEMAIEILETMDDCVVARKAAKMISRALTRAKERTTAEEDDTQRSTNAFEYNPYQGLTNNAYWGPLSLMDGEIDVNFPFQMTDLYDTSSIFGEAGPSTRLH